MRDNGKKEWLEARVRAVADRLRRLLDELQKVSWQIWDTVERQRASDAKLLEINLRLQKTLSAIPKKAARPGKAGGCAARGAGGGGAAGSPQRRPVVEKLELPLRAPEEAAEPAVQAEPNELAEPEAAAADAARGFTYLDYLELRAEEFGKFRAMPPISDAEIRAFDPTRCGL